MVVQGSDRREMSQETYEYVGKGLRLLKEGLAPFVEMRLKSMPTGRWKVKVSKRYPAVRNRVEDGKIFWDTSALLKIMEIFWKEAFSDLKNPANSYVGEAIVARNRWAHQHDFTHEDADRAIDTMRRLLEIVGKKGVDVKEIIKEFDKLREEMKPAVTEDVDSTSPPYWKSYAPKMR